MRTRPARPARPRAPRASSIPCPARAAARRRNRRRSRPGSRSPPRGARRHRQARTSRDREARVTSKPECHRGLLPPPQASTREGGTGRASARRPDPPATRLSAVAHLLFCSMFAFWVNTEDGRVATYDQLDEAGLVADEKPAAPWHPIQGPSDASTMWYSVLRRSTRGVFIGTLCFRHT